MHHILNGLLTSDFIDAFPTLSKIAGIICPLGTANVERSFSSMNRICNRLRQRLTVDHLDSLLLIAQEGPQNPSPDILKQIVYTWYKKRSRKIQLPAETEVVATTSVHTSTATQHGE